MSRQSADRHKHNAEENDKAVDAGSARTADDAQAAAAEAERRDIVIHANYELFVVGFLFVQLVNSALILSPLGSEQHQIAVGFWLGISIFLVIDVIIRWRRAYNKRRYIFSLLGWLNWIGSMPAPFFTSARLLGTAYGLRKLRRGEFKEMGNVVVARHAQATLLLILFLTVLFFEFGSLLILLAEQSSPIANIKTSLDAIWWSVVTISTVGYGDTYPTTYWGRVIGFVLIITGVGLFTSITSFMARWFMRPRQEQQAVLKSASSVAGPQTQIREIRSLLQDLEDNHRQTIDDLENRLKQLESSVAPADKSQ